MGIEEMKGFRQFDDLFWKYMLAYKKRTIFTILSITLAVILFFGAGTLYISVYQALCDSSTKQNGDYDASGIVNPEEYQRMKKLDYIDDMLLCDFSDSMFTMEGEAPISIQYLESFDQSFYDYTLLQGRYPENDRELLMNQVQASILGVETGDSIQFYTYEFWYGDTCIGGSGEAWEFADKHTEYDEQGKLTEDSITMDDFERRKNINEYQLVGIYETDITISTFLLEYYPMISQIDKEQNYSSMSVLVRFRNHKNYINKLMQEEGIYLDEHWDVTMYRKGYESSEMDPLLQYILFMITFAILFWIAVIIIRNVFVMSMAERARDYGILRCMGISQRRLRMLLCKEGLAMAGIACVLGFGITAVMIQFGKYLGGFRQLLQAIGIFDTFHMVFSPWMIAGSIGFTFCAVLFSLLEPARQIGAIAPVDAIIGRKSIKKEKFKRRKGGLVRKVLGVEGEYAYKNVMRNKGKFIASMVGIAISVVGIMIGSNIVQIVKAAFKDTEPGINYDTYLFFYNSEGMTLEEIEQLEEDFSVLDSIREVRIDFETYMSSDGKNYGLPTNRNRDTTVYSNYRAYGFDEEQLAELVPYLIDGELDYEALKQGGVILCRSSLNYNYLNGEWVESKIQQTDLEVGDTIWIPRETLTYDSNGKVILDAFIQDDGSLKDEAVIYCPVVAVVDYYPKSLDSTLPDVIFAREFYLENLIRDDANSIGSIAFRAISEENYDIEEIYRFQKQHPECFLEDGGYHEILDAAKGFQQLVLLVTVILAGIGALNIFNTLSSNITLRKRELQMMSAVGMSRKQIWKMLGLEGGLAAIIGSVIGVGIGVLIGYWITLFMHEVSASIKYQIPWLGIVCSALLAVMITGVSVIIAKWEMKTWEE